jgi:N-acetylmuramoyl-L-alanine amidase
MLDCHRGKWGWAGFALLSVGLEGADGLKAWSDLREEAPVASWSATAELLSEVLVPHAETEKWFRQEAEALWVRTHRKHPGVWLELPWSAEDAAKPLLPPVGPAERPLEGFRIALDPGHIGGEWGPMERRSFSLEDGPVVQEGDLVHQAARRMQPALEALGAEVLILHEAGQPATEERPADFYLEAFRDLLRESEGLPDPAEVQRRAEIRFYRRAEIEARAARVAAWQPHLVVALHIDAGAWPDPEAPSAIEANYGHILVHGAYMDSELADDAQRQWLLRRWRRGYPEVEISLGTVLAEAMAEMTGLEPFIYRGKNATRVNDNPYLFARNLMANRIYEAPVIYLEPWVLNDATVYRWAGEGDYDGEREIAGTLRPSLPSTYAAFVVEGLRRWASTNR